MKMSAVFPSKYASASDLGGKVVTLVMDKVIMEEMGQGTEKSMKPVLIFKNATKGLVLNVTNARIISALYGDESDDWKGRRISLHVVKVKAFGQTTDAIRVIDQIPPAPRPKDAPAPTPTAPTPPAVEEPSEIDDHEDYSDDEPPYSGDSNPFDDPTVGASAPAAATAGASAPGREAKPRVLTPFQLGRIEKLGATLHGPSWPSHRSNAAQTASKGVVNQLSDLLPSEAEVLIKEIELKLSERIHTTAS